MREQNLGELDRLFSQAQVDLPHRLRARLLAIPRLERRVRLWDWRRALPITACTPGVLWLIIRHGLPFLEGVFGFLSRLPAGVSLPVSLAVNPLVMISLSAIAAAVMGIATWLYIWQGAVVEVRHFQRLQLSK